MLIYLYASDGTTVIPEDCEDHAAVARQVITLLRDGALYVDQVAAEDYRMRNRYSVLSRDDEGEPDTFVVETFDGQVLVMPAGDKHDQPLE